MSAQTISRRPIVSYFVSPCESQLTTALDTLQKYENLYQLEQGKSFGLNTLYEIEVGRRIRADQSTTYAQVERDTARAQRNRAEVDRDTQKARADTAVAALQPALYRIGRYEGRTWAGKKLRKADKVVKYVGYGTVGYLLLRIGLRFLF